MNKLANTPIIYTLWKPNEFNLVDFLIEYFKAMNEIMKPIRSVTRCKQSLMTAIECDMIPPASSATINIKLKVIAKMSFL